MKKTKSFTMALAGLGLSATLFLGCQDLLGQSRGSGNATDPNSTTQDLSVRSSNKGNLPANFPNSDTGLTKLCHAMRDAIKSPPGGGDRTELEARFKKLCVDPFSGEAPVTFPKTRNDSAWKACQALKGEIIEAEPGSALRLELEAKVKQVCGDPSKDTLPGQNKNPNSGDKSKVRSTPYDYWVLCNGMVAEKIMAGSDKVLQSKLDADYLAICGDPSKELDHVKFPEPDSSALWLVCHGLELDMDMVAKGSDIHSNLEEDYHKVCIEHVSVLGTVPNP